MVERMSDPTKFKTYAITVVFDSKGNSPNENKWLYIFRKNILGKVRRMLVSGKEKREEVLEIPDIYQYEYDILSNFRVSSASRYVHHIHGLLPIPIDLVHRIADEDGQINERLQKDLNSVVDVTSVLMEPTKDGCLETWLSYMTKGKNHSQFSWNK